MSLTIGTNLRINRASRLNKSTYIAEYNSVYNLFVAKPSDADALIQNTMLKALVDGGYYAKAEFLDVFSAHGEAESLFNWRDPAGAHNPTVVNSPVWTQYEGFKGNVAGGRYGRTNFIPSVDKTVMSGQSVCYIIGLGDDVDEALWDFGVFDGSEYVGIVSRASNVAYFAINDGVTAATTANIDSKKHYAIGRNGFPAFDSYINLTRTAKSADYLAAATKELFFCGYNNNAVAAPCNKTVRYLFVFSNLTEAEVLSVIIIMETYLDNYSKGLI